MTGQYPSRQRPRRSTKSHQTGKRLVSSTPKSAKPTSKSRAILWRRSKMPKTSCTILLLQARCARRPKAARRFFKLGTSLLTTETLKKNKCSSARGRSYLRRTGGTGSRESRTTWIKTRQSSTNRRWRRSRSFSSRRTRSTCAEHEVSLGLMLF